MPGSFNKCMFFVKNVITFAKIFAKTGGVGTFLRGKVCDQKCLNGFCENKIFEKSIFRIYLSKYTKLAKFFANLKGIFASTLVCRLEE